MADLTSKTGQRFTWDPAGKQWVEQSAPGQPFDFNAGQMVANIPGSAVQLGQDLAAPVIHPIDTASALGNIGIGLAAKLFPGKQEQEVFADALGAMLKDRYGSVDNFQRTLQNDPVGVVSDIAGLVMGGGATAAKTSGKLSRFGRAAEKAGRAVDPVSLAARGAAKGFAKIPGMQAAAEHLFRSGSKLATSRKGNPVKTAQVNKEITRTALREKLVPGEAGRNALGARIGELGQQVDDLIDAADASGVTIRNRDILDKMDEAMAAADLPGDPARRKDVARLQRIKQQFIESVADPNELAQLEAAVKAAPDSEARDLARLDLDSYLDDIAENGTITAGQAQAAKERLGQRLNFQGKQGTPQMVAQEGQQAIRRGERAAIEQAVPEIGPVNARMAALLELQDPFNQATNRITNLQGVGLGSLASTGGGGVIGAALGSPAAGIAGGAALGLLMDPRGSTRVAMMMQRLIDSGVDPAIAAKLRPLLMMQAQKGAGRASDEEAFQNMPAAIQRTRRGRNARNR